MKDLNTLDTLTVEARARAMRAAYMRDAVRGLVARLRGGRVPAAKAHA